MNSTNTFQFTASDEADRSGRATYMNKQFFQFTASDEADRDPVDGTFDTETFQFTASDEADPPVRNIFFYYISFNSQPQMRLTLPMQDCQIY